MSTSPDANGRTVIGRIAGAHGVRGVFRVIPLTDFPERFLDMREMRVDRSGAAARTLVIKDVTVHSGKGVLLVAADGIVDRDAAELLRGFNITVAHDERVELPDDEFWVDSIIGLSVIDDDSGEQLGTVVDVFRTGANDIYEVRTPSGQTKALPAIADVVRKIDIDGGCMRVTLMEGLWD